MEKEEKENFVPKADKDIGEIKPSLSGTVSFPTENRMSHIKNKQVRTKKYQKVKRELKKVCLNFFLYCRIVKTIFS